MTSNQSRERGALDVSDRAPLLGGESVQATDIGKSAQFGGGGITGHGSINSRNGQITPNVNDLKSEFRE